jgi:hypothetical protein
MPSGGQLLIRVEHDTAANPWTSATPARASPDKLRQIFDPFFTISRPR